MKISFRRITTGNFIAEIDGLRFVAIAGVVLYHLNTFITAKATDAATAASGRSWGQYLLSHGHLGVPLFFVISGFVLAIPFARFHLENGKPVSLRKYFSKRLTRLEPPYVFVMTALLIGAVFIAKTLSLTAGIESYLASVVYIHNFVFPGTLPKLNVVVWSLELEVQFYVLTPLITYVFAVKPALLRRLLLVVAIMAMIALNRFNLNPLPVLSLVDYLQFFLTGYLLADIYLTTKPVVLHTRYDSVVCLVSFAMVWLFDVVDFEKPLQKFVCELIQVSSIFIFYYYVLFRKSFKILRAGFITNIGGMCYTIYLLHYPIISLFGGFLLRHSSFRYPFVNTLFYYGAMIVLILLVSAVFFLLVERPCMNGNWYKKVFGRRVLQTGSV